MTLAFRCMIGFTLSLRVLVQVGMFLVTVPIAVAIMVGSVGCRLVVSLLARRF